MKVNLRKWTIEDLPLIQEILWKTWITSLGNFIPEDDLRKYFLEHYNDNTLLTRLYQQNTDCFIAQVNDNITVAVEITNFNQERYNVSSLYVLPEFQTMGIGKKLLRLAVKEAQSLGLNKVWIGVMTDNKKALDWYSKFGFNITERLPFTMGKTTVSLYIGYIMFNC